MNPAGWLPGLVELILRRARVLGGGDLADTVGSRLFGNASLADGPAPGKVLSRELIPFSAQHCPNCVHGREGFPVRLRGKKGDVRDGYEPPRHDTGRSAPEDPAPPRAASDGE